ncbi:MAG TPA: NAD(P)-dependent glycerol-3-phosphate dehydrogenase [Gammaproteobacteria bacterium]|nr:NAD(P)-dependent glycerol-3-phosphate dehydrogenase [Gammaproteobacteria bacterium]
MSTPVAVLGAGAWGTALAILLARNGHPVSLWTRDPAHVAAMRDSRRNERHLPGIDLPPLIRPESGLDRVVTAARDLLVAVPSHAFRHIMAQLARHDIAGHRIAWASKGLERQTAKLLHEVATEELHADVPLAVVSGPSFAREVAEGLPTAVTVASHHREFAQSLAERLHNPQFRAYTSSDVVGVEVGGAVKNALAIAVGIADGLGFGANTRAALVTRGLAEMMRLGAVLGGRRETLMGLAGLGDLVLTCTDNQSRNRRLGLRLGQGRKLADAAGELGLTEGVSAAREVTRKAGQWGVEMPICEQAHRVLQGECSPRQAVDALLSREQKAEWA